MADLTLTDALDVLVRAGRIKSAWRPGMRTDTGIRVVAVYADEKQPHIVGWLPGSSRTCIYYTDPPLFAPDTSDPLTVMGLLLLAREAHYNDPRLCVASVCPRRNMWPERRHWMWESTRHGVRDAGPDATELDAIIAALVAAAREVARG